MFHVPEKYRVTTGPMRSTESLGNNGAFLINSLKIKRPLVVIASDREGWEHVSVSHPTTTPTWDEMCFIKSLFWDEEDTVMQLHPPKSEYVNNHGHCLHLWRPIDKEIPRPHSLLVGLQNVGQIR